MNFEFNHIMSQLTESTHAPRTALFTFSDSECTFCGSPAQLHCAQCGIFCSTCDSAFHAVPARSNHQRSAVTPVTDNVHQSELTNNSKTIIAHEKRSKFDLQDQENLDEPQKAGKLAGKHLLGEIITKCTPKKSKSTALTSSSTTHSNLSVQCQLQSDARSSSAKSMSDSLVFPAVSSSKSSSRPGDELTLADLDTIDLNDNNSSNSAKASVKNCWSKDFAIPVNKAPKPASKAMTQKPSLSLNVPASPQLPPRSSSRRNRVENSVPSTPTAGSQSAAVTPALKSILRRSSSASASQLVTPQREVESGQQTPKASKATSSLAEQNQLDLKGLEDLISQKLLNSSQQGSTASSLSLQSILAIGVNMGLQMQLQQQQQSSSAQQNSESMIARMLTQPNDWVTNSGLLANLSQPSSASSSQPTTSSTASSLSSSFRPAGLMSPLAVKFRARAQEDVSNQGAITPRSVSPSSRFSFQPNFSAASSPVSTSNSISSSRLPSKSPYASRLATTACLRTPGRMPSSSSSSTLLSRRQPTNVSRLERSSVQLLRELDVLDRSQQHKSVSSTVIVDEDAEFNLVNKRAFVDDDDDHDLEANADDESVRQQAEQACLTSLGLQKFNRFSLPPLSIHSSWESSSSSAHVRHLLLKLLVVGNAKCGKTSLIARYTRNEFSDQYQTTIGSDFARKQLAWDTHTQIRVNLWDVAGQDRFASLTRPFFSGAAGALVVCDVTRPASLEAARQWKAALDERLDPDYFASNAETQTQSTSASTSSTSWTANSHASGGKMTRGGIPVILVANKSDLLQGGATSVAIGARLAQLANECGFAGWFIASAKRDSNVALGVEFLVSQILRRQHEQQQQQANGAVEGGAEIGKNGGAVDLMAALPAMAYSSYGCCT